MVRQKQYSLQWASRHMPLEVKYTGVYFYEVMN